MKDKQLWQALLFMVGVTLVVLQSYIIFRLPVPSTVSPEDVKALLESGTVTVVVPDRWTGSQQEVYAATVEDRLKALEEKQP